MIRNVSCPGLCVGVQIIARQNSKIAPLRAKITHSSSSLASMRPPRYEISEKGREDQTRRHHPFPRALLIIFFGSTAGKSSAAETSLPSTGQTLRLDAQQRRDDQGAFSVETPPSVAPCLRCALLADSSLRRACGNVKKCSLTTVRGLQARESSECMRRATLKLSACFGPVLTPSPLYPVT